MLLWLEEGNNTEPIERLNLAEPIERLNVRVACVAAS